MFSAYAKKCATNLLIFAGGAFDAVGAFADAAISGMAVFPEKTIYFCSVTTIATITAVVEFAEFLGFEGPFVKRRLKILEDDDSEETCGILEKLKSCLCCSTNSLSKVYNFFAIEKNLVDWIFTVVYGHDWIKEFYDVYYNIYEDDPNVEKFDWYSALGAILFYMAFIAGFEYVTEILKTKSMISGKEETTTLKNNKTIAKFIFHVQSKVQVVKRVLPVVMLIAPHNLKNLYDKGNLGYVGLGALSLNIIFSSLAVHQTIAVNELPIAAEKLGLEYQPSRESVSSWLRLPLIITWNATSAIPVKQLIQSNSDWDSLEAISLAMLLALFPTLNRHLAFSSEQAEHHHEARAGSPSPRRYEILVDAGGDETTSKTNSMDTPAV